MLSAIDAIRQRHSVRAFLDTPVEAPALHRVFELAQWAPSNCNTQPWLTHVVSGDACERLRQQLLAAAQDPAGIAPDFPYDGKYDGVYRARQVDAAVRLYGATGVARDDRAARQRSFLRNYAFFGAPHVAFVFMPEPFGLREAADCGMYAQTLLLALQAEGLGSCIQTALSFHAPLVRQALGVAPVHKLLFGISFGHPDPADPANTCRTERAPVHDAVRFHG